MRKSKDMIILGDHMGQWHSDFASGDFVAHDDALDDVKAAVERLNAEHRRQEQTGEYR